MTLLAKARGGPVIHYQVLFCPVTDAALDTHSYTRFADGRWLTRNSMEWFWSQIAPDRAVRAEPTDSPLRASLPLLQGLPPALVITSGADVLCDEGVACGRKLRHAGIDVTDLCYAGIIDGFVVINALTETIAASDAVAEATPALKRALCFDG